MYTQRSALGYISGYQRLWFVRLGALGLLAAFLYLTPQRLYGATPIVTNTNDSGPGSLRQAIADAIPGDTVTFDATLQGQTIRLSTTVTLTKDVTITGETLPAPITLSGNRAVRVLAIAPGVTATLRGLIIADGRGGSGAGLYNQGVATLYAVQFYRNRMQDRVEVGPWVGDGGAINNMGQLQVISSTFHANESFNGGGAISSSGPLTIIGSLFRENRAPNGGAINAGSTLVVSTSAFLDNAALSRGGAIYTYGFTTIERSSFQGNQAGIGGAVRYFADITIVNSTFSGNQGGVLSNSGSMIASGKLSVYNSTFVGNRAPFGVVVAHTGFQLYNSIIADSYGRDCGITPNPNINNLIADGSCAAAITGDARIGPGQPGSDPLDAFLLLPDSPAIDAGDQATCPPIDQLGQPRPIDGDDDGVATCDIGAFERQPVTSTPELYLRGNGVWISDGDKRPALADHTDFGQTAHPGERITRTFVISNLGAIDLTDVRVAFNGAQAAAFHLIQPPSPTLAAGQRSAFVIDFHTATLGVQTTTVTIHGNAAPAPLYTFAVTGRDCRPALTVRNTDDAGAGSLRQALADLCSNGSIGFAADLAGQTIVLQQPLLLAKNSTVDGATTATAVILSGDKEVRVIHVATGVQATLKRLIIADGRGADGYGGGIYNQGALTITNSTLLNNFAPLYSTDLRFPPSSQGGGIYNFGQLAINNSTFTGNGADHGGALFSDWRVTDTITITNSTFSSNRAGVGSALFAPAVLYNTLITADSNSLACLNAVATVGNNLIQDGSCNALLTGDPRLGPLQDNGGGILTQALLPDSPALDAGDNSLCLPTDQRGIARPLDGNGDGIATCDLGAVEAPTSTVVITATPTPIITPTPTNTPSPTSPNTSHTPTPTATPLPTLPPIPTEIFQFDVRVYVAAPVTPIAIGETITVAVTVDNRSIACLYPLYELTLNELGGPLFRFDSPATVKAPIGTQTIYTLTATTPGVIALQAVAYGESDCGGIWQWRYVNGSTYPVTVVPQAPATLTPTPTVTATSTGAPLPAPTLTAPASGTATPLRQPTAIATSPLPPLLGDGNGDQVIDLRDISACIQELFDDDGSFWQDAPGGSYPGAPGCDANQDTQIDAGDVSCTLLLIYKGVTPCNSGSGQGAAPATANLTIASDRVAVAGASVEIPITLTTNGATVTAGAFRLHVDPTRLRFDPTDRNGDALPDAVVFTLPPLISRPLLTVTARADSLDLVFTELAAAPVAWQDGVFLTITLRVHPLESALPVMTTVAFDQSVIPSLGSATGASIPVQAEDGLVQIMPMASQEWLYLPLVTRQ